MTPADAEIGAAERRDLGTGSSRRHVAWRFGLGLSLLVGGLTSLLVFGTLFGARNNLYTMESSLIWTAIGPHLVLLSLLALVVSGAGLRRRPRGLSTVATVLSAIALAASTVITTRIMRAIDAAGGSANPITGLWISSMSAASPDARETYTTAGGQRLHALIYRPASARGAAPVLLYIHGGGWITGHADGTAADLRWFADQGWLVVSVEYRLASASRPTWDKAPEDVACALVWTARRAPRLGGDPQRIVVFGESAGGNLAVNLSYAAALGQARSGCGGHVPVPAATVAEYPVVDPQNAYDHPVPFSGPSPKAFTSEYIGGTSQEFPGRMRAISSATYVSMKAPPTLIIEPEDDGLIPPEGVYRFVDQARAAGVDITLVRIPFANHGFDVGALLPLPAANSLGNQSHSITQHYLEQRGLI